MNSFTVNGKEYVAKQFDFNLICDLEDMGVSITTASEKPMSMVRAYFAVCAGGNKDYAGKEMEAHIFNGGTFDDVVNAMSEEMEKSDFFRNLSKKEEKETPKNQSKKK